MRWLVISVLALGILVACGGEGDDRADTVAVATATSTTAVPEITSDASPTDDTDSEDQELTAASPTTDASPTVAATETSQADPAKESSPTAMAESADPEATTPIDENLVSALLTLDDLPVGWTTSELGDDDDSDDAGICGTEPLDDLVKPIGKAEAEFQQSNLGPFLSESLAVYESTDDAQSVMEAARSTFTCSEWTDTNAEGEETVWSISPLSFPTIGDETFVLRLSANIGIANMEYDAVFFRMGDKIALVGHIDLGSVDSDQTVEFAQLAAEKLE